MGEDQYVQKLFIKDFYRVRVNFFNTKKFYYFFKAANLHIRIYY